MKIRPSYYLVPAVILIIGSLAFTKGTGGKSKIGHLHTNALWELMPDKKKADTAIAIKQNELATYFEQKRKEFADKWQLYTKDSASLTGAIKEQRVKEILDLQKNLDEILKERGLEKYFKGNYGAPINKVEVLKKIMSDEKVLPEEILYIGDSLEDHQAAELLGISFIGKQSDRLLNGKTNNVFTEFVQIRKYFKKKYNI